jgi:hypothetical protein
VHLNSNVEYGKRVPEPTPALLLLSGNHHIDILYSQSTRLGKHPAMLLPEDQSAVKHPGSGEGLLTQHTRGLPLVRK